MGIGKKYIIDVKDYVNMHIGKKTLDKIENKIKKLKKYGYNKIIIDIEGLGINTDYHEMLARFIYDYGVHIKGLGIRKSNVFAYLHTGYFIKKNIGETRYIKWFKRQLEISDYPLIIKDNRLSGIETTEINVVKPLYFDDYYFYYDLIKPHYLEPYKLEKAVEYGEDIYNSESIRIVDIAKKDIGFRFAGTERERLMLDIFEEILIGRVKGFNNK